MKEKRGGMPGLGRRTPPPRNEGTGTVDTTKSSARVSGRSLAVKKLAGNRFEIAVTTSAGRPWWLVVFENEAREIVRRLTAELGAA
jgi:hypothetical protein